MSFLDNLENNLKALESREEKDPETVKRERAAQDAKKAVALQSAPFAEALKNGPFTVAFLTACRTIGHGMRTLVRPTWVDSTLRLDAGERRVELKPTPSGVIAVFFENGVQQESEPVDLDSGAEDLARRWLLKEPADGAQ